MNDSALWPALRRRFTLALVVALLAVAVVLSLTIREQIQALFGL